MIKGIRSLFREIMYLIHYSLLSNLLSNNANGPLKCFSRCNFGEFGDGEKLTRSESLTSSTVILNVPL